MTFKVKLSDILRKFLTMRHGDKRITHLFFGVVFCIHTSINKLIRVPEYTLTTMNKKAVG